MRLLSIMPYVEYKENALHLRVEAGAGANHDNTCGDRGQHRVQASKTEESGSPGYVNSYLPENALSTGCQANETAARKVSSLAEHRDNVLVENTVPAQEARVNAAPQVPSVLEATFIRLPEGSASETELSGAEGCSATRDHCDHTYARPSHGCLAPPQEVLEHRDNVLVDNAVPVQEARANEARQAALPQAPSAAQTPTINSVTGVAAEVLSQVPCTSHRDVRRKTKELKAKLREQRDLNRRLQARLQRQRQALTLGEVVRSVRSHVSPAVAALVEAQLRMNNEVGFGGRDFRQRLSGIMSMSRLALPPPFLPTPGRPAVSWPQWLRIFENFLLASGASDCTPDHREALLLHSLGVEGQRIFYTLPHPSR
ncbi:hypothetical protein MTO96_038483 [Rhipicephalus appendiculatus]